MESPEIDPHKYSQLNFNKRAKQSNRTKILFLENGVRTTGHPHVKKKRIKTHT